MKRKFLIENCKSELQNQDIKHKGYAYKYLFFSKRAR